MNGGRIARGDAAMEIIEREISLHSQAILDLLEPYDAASTIATWHAVLRAAEEFINIPLFGIDDERTARRLMALPLGDALAANPNAAIEARDAITPHFGYDLARRFMITMIQLSRADAGLRQSGRSLAGGFTLDTVAAGMGFLQSRRRHFVSLLYAMPGACRGSKILPPEHAYDVMLPLVEYCCDGVTGWNWKKIQLLTLPDFSLDIDDVGAMSSHGFNPLGAMFLEPERISIMDMAAHRRDQIGEVHHEPLNPRLIFSAAELRNNVRLTKAAFAHFGLDDAAFGAVSRLIMLFSRYCRDDYYIEVPLDTFAAALSSQIEFPSQSFEDMLVSHSGAYADCANGYEPFLRVGDRLVSNVLLLTRFINMFKNLHLASRRSFLSNAGFIFENMVSQELAAAGFTVTEIKRINRKEFDVVTTLDDAIHNFQCKNNWIDLSKVERDARLYARYNRSLVRYYKRALGKERRREQLLIDTLDIGNVHHYVVSRFAVISDDPAIINFNELQERAAQIVAAQDSPRI